MRQLLHYVDYQIAYVLERVVYTIRFLIVRELSDCINNLLIILKQYESCSIVF